MNLSTEPVQLILSLLYISSFDTSFMFMCACADYTDFNTCLLTRICQYTCDCLCTPFGIHHTTRWGVSDSPESVCPDPEA